ncbi:MAG: hypothetical protein Q8O57_08560 [Kiritimatiellota bacterium]|nr:hypothetical protein [Kiritimatiellota bacterium]
MTAPIKNHDGPATENNHLNFIVAMPLPDIRLATESRKSGMFKAIIRRFYVAQSHDGAIR